MYCWPCFNGLRGAPSRSNAVEDLEQIIAFLSDVPLLRRDLPKSDILLLARELKTRLYKKGDVLVNQGDRKQEFFLLMNGVAELRVGGKLKTHLIRGDYWGDGTVIRMRPSAGTVIASVRCQVLSLSRARFEKLGLHEKVRFPKRLAVYDGLTKPVTLERNRIECDAVLRREDKELVVEAFKNCTSLQVHLHVYDKALYTLLANRAVLIRKKPGEEIAKCGDFPRAVYIIKEGQVEMMPHLSHDTGVPQITNAERAIVQRTLKASSLEAPQVWRKTVKADQEENLDSRRRCFSEFPYPKPTTRKSKKTLYSLPEDRAVTLQRGDIFGEVAPMYNTPRVASFKAAGDADVLMFAVGRYDFKECYYFDGEDYDYICELLNDVPILSSLFNYQRQLLARNASGFRHFDQGELVVEFGFGKEENQLWFVVASGSAIMHRVDIAAQPITLNRGDTFGERSLLVDQVDEMTVHAGEGGMDVLVIQGEVFKNLGLSESDTAALLGDVADFTQQKEVLTRGRAEQKYLSCSISVDPQKLKVDGYLGRGAFGFVAQMVNETTGETYALKRISKGLLKESRMQKMVRNEKDLMSLVDSPFIVRLYSCWRDDQFIYMLQDCMRGPNLDVLRQRHAYLFDDDPNASAAQFFLGSITLGLDFLHRMKILYRDLKPENVLTDSCGQVKICDMGFAKLMFDKTHTCCGTAEYMAPELLDGKKRIQGYGFGVDWWALGIVAFELFSGHPPFESNGEGEQREILENMLRLQRQPFPIALLSKLSESAKDFVRRLLMPDVERRLGFSGSLAVQKHKWFVNTGFDFVMLAKHSVTPPHKPDLKPLPPVELWDENGAKEILMVRYEDSKLSGSELLTQRVKPEQAPECCLEVATQLLGEGSDSCCGGWTYNAQAEDDGCVLAHFMKDSPDRRAMYGWISYRCFPDLFLRWVDDGTGWDAHFGTFELPLALRIAHKHGQKRCNVRGDRSLL